MITLRALCVLPFLFLACQTPSPARSEQAQQNIAAVLDDFHDAAAKGDGERYFGHLAPDGVFLGTDGKERWGAAAFAKTFARYFDGKSAWVYTPTSRHISRRGDLAWFDEALDSTSYGACRGSGCLVRDGGQWKILLYHLSIPVPNELAKGIVAQIRGGAPQAQAAATTTVILVRHAEKLKGRDPDLSEAGKARALRLVQHLGAAGVDRCYVTQFKRTQQTLAPLARILGQELEVVDARARLGTKILAAHRGGCVVVAGHSNTVPAIMAQLGVKDPGTIDESVYDNLFVVTVPPQGPARLLRLKF